jgi:hypothetical protein
LDEDQLISGFLSVNPPDGNSQKAYTQKLNEAYGWAKAVSQKYYEKGKSEALQIIQKKAAASTEPPTQAAKSMVWLALGAEASRRGYARRVLGSAARTQRLTQCSAKGIWQVREGLVGPPV